MPRGFISNFQIKFGESLERGGPLGSTILKWNEGVLAGNGKIYGSPYRATSVIEIDPSNGQVSTFGTLSSDINKWYNITLANDGKLYCIPNNVTDVLEIDPVNRTVNTYSGATSPVATAVKWPQAVLAGNGNIYGIPNRAQDVLEFNPTTKGLNLFGGFADNVPKWGKGVLAQDGNIYACPIQAGTTVLEIDPTVPSAVARTTSISGTAQYNECLVLGDKLFLIPMDATGVGVFNISTKAFTTFGNYTDTSKWNHAVQALNGKVYCIPRKVPYVLEFDPVTEAHSTFGNVGDPSKDLQWNKGVLGDNGMIYALPAYQNGTILEIDPYNKTAREFGNYLQDVNFHWPYCTKGGNGKIYGIPNDTETVLEVIP